MKNHFSKILLFVVVVLVETPAFAQSQFASISPILTDSMRLLRDGLPASEMYLLDALPASARDVYGRGLPNTVSIAPIPLSRSSYSGFRLTNADGLWIEISIFNVSEKELEMAQRSADPAVVNEARNIQRDINYRAAIFPRTTDEYSSIDRERKSVGEEIKQLEQQLTKQQAAVATDPSVSLTATTELQNKIEFLRAREASLTAAYNLAVEMSESIASRYYQGRIEDRTTLYYQLSQDRYQTLHPTVVHDFLDAALTFERKYPGTVRQVSSSLYSPIFMVTITDKVSLLDLLEFQEKVSRTLTRPSGTSSTVVGAVCAALF